MHPCPYYFTMECRRRQLGYHLRVLRNEIAKVLRVDAAMNWCARWQQKGSDK